MGVSLGLGLLTKPHLFLVGPALALLFVTLWWRARGHRGRIVEVFGPESSGKTTLALHAIAEAQRSEGTCAFLDAEHALDVPADLDDAAAHAEEDRRLREVADARNRADQLVYAETDSTFGLGIYRSRDGRWVVSRSDEHGDREGFVCIFRAGLPGDLSHLRLNAGSRRRGGAELVTQLGILDARKP